MKIEIDIDYIVSLYDCDFDTAANILAAINDHRDKLMDNIDDAIIKTVRSIDFGVVMRGDDDC